MSADHGLDLPEPTTQEIRAEDQVFNALVKQLNVQRHYLENHEPTAEEVHDRGWLEKCLILLDRLEQAEKTASYNEDRWDAAVRAAEREEERAEQAESRLAEREAGALGYAWTYACTLIDKGIDIRQWEVPKLIDAYNKAILEKKDA